MTSGIHYTVSREDYRALPHLNQSLLKKWIELGAIPSEFKYWRDNPDPPSESQILGDALDCSLLDPDIFESRFAIAPQCDRRTTAGKSRWRDFLLEADGREIIAHYNGVALSNMTLALLAHESTRDVFRHCKKAVFIGQLWGFDCKAEIDLWNDNSSHILDLKTCKDVSPKPFARDFINYGYDKQAAFYLHLANALGIEKHVFDFICVRNTPPWTVAVYSFDRDNEKHGQMYYQALAELRQAAGELTIRLKDNNFEDSKDWHMLDIPRWAIKREMEYV